MRLTVLGIALLASASAIGEGYITSVRLPDGTTKTFQDAGARQEIQDILSQKYLKPESVKAGDNVSVTTNGYGEVTISADRSDVDPLLLAQYYPEGNVKSAAEFTPGIKYNFVATNRTATVKTFGPTLSGDDNRNIVGRVVIPPFVDGDGNPYLTDDGTRYKVVGVAGDISDLADEYNDNLRDVIAPLCVISIGDAAFSRCRGMDMASFPGATRIEQMAFFQSGLNEAVFPAATYVGINAFNGCLLSTVVLPNVSELGEAAFYDCSLPEAVVLPSVGRVKESAFHGCYGFTSIDMPLVKHIEANAFNGCANLRAVSVPSINGDWSVDAEKSFGDAAFAGCYRLEKVDFGGKSRGQYKIPTLGENVFPDDGKIGKCTFVVPDADRNLWPTATVWKDLKADLYGYMSHSELEYARKYETFTIKVEDNVLIFSPQE